MPSGYEDDALIGVKSTARLFGSQTRLIVSGFYAGAYVLWLAAATIAGAGIVFAVLSLVAAAFWPGRCRRLMPRYRAIAGFGSIPTAMVGADAAPGSLATCLARMGAGERA